MDSAIASARQAFSRHDWLVAHDAFVSADRDGALEAGDLRMSAGGGVHVAARFGAIGGREEIVVSADTLAAAGTIRFPVSDARSVVLKGVEGTVEVRSILWSLPS